MNLYRITFHPAVVLESEHDFLSKSASTYCARRWWKHLHSIFQILKKEWNTYNGDIHYVLRVLKTCLWDPRCQTYVFESRIVWEIQIWLQNNQFQTLLSNDFFKKLFSGQKNHRKKLDVFFDFWIFTAIYMNNLDQF